MDAGGTPFLYNADTPWMLFTKLTEPETKAYITRRKDQGFTAFQVMLTGYLGTAHRAREQPFAGTPPEHNVPQPNENFFAHVGLADRQEIQRGLLCPDGAIR